MASLTRGFDIPAEERQVRDKDLILRRLTEWSAKAEAEFGTNSRYKFQEEFKNYGLLDHFLRKLEQGKTIDMNNMLAELLMQDTMASIIGRLEGRGMNATIKNYDGSYFALEVTKCKMSFGKIYAYLESMKDQYFIKEYSCKLSSLEEIFNAHATESMFMDLNKRIERKRTSTFKSLQESAR